jgi:hypothetical protein
MSSREDYIKKLQLQLDKWNAEIYILKEDAQRAEANTKESYEKRIEQLRKKCQAAKGKIRQIQESNNIGWKELKEGLKESWKGIKQIFSDTKTEFCKGLEEGKKS